MDMWLWAWLQPALVPITAARTSEHGIIRFVMGSVTYSQWCRPPTLSCNTSLTRSLTSPVGVKPSLWLQIRGNNHQSSREEEKEKERKNERKARHPALLFLLSSSSSTSSAPAATGGGICCSAGLQIARENEMTSSGSDFWIKHPTV